MFDELTRAFDMTTQQFSSDQPEYFSLEAVAGRQTVTSLNKRVTNIVTGPPCQELFGMHMRASLQR